MKRDRSRSASCPHDIEKGRTPRTDIFAVRFANVGGRTLPRARETSTREPLGRRHFLLGWMRERETWVSPQSRARNRAGMVKAERREGVPSSPISTARSARSCLADPLRCRDQPPNETSTTVSDKGDRKSEKQVSRRAFRGVVQVCARPRDVPDVLLPRLLSVVLKGRPGGGV